MADNDQIDFDTIETSETDDLLNILHPKSLDDFELLQQQGESERLLGETLEAFAEPDIRIRTGVLDDDEEQSPEQEQQQREYNDDADIEEEEDEISASPRENISTRQHGTPNYDQQQQQMSSPLQLQVDSDKSPEEAQFTQLDDSFPSFTSQSDASSNERYERRNEDGSLESTSKLSINSVLGMAETVGIELSQDAAETVGDEAMKHLRHAVLIAMQFSSHENSRGLCVSDLERAEEIMDSKKSFGHDTTFGSAENFDDEGPEIDLLETIKSSEINELVLTDTDPTFNIHETKFENEYTNSSEEEFHDVDEDLWLLEEEKKTVESESEYELAKGTLQGDEVVDAINKNNDADQMEEDIEIDVESDLNYPTLQNFSDIDCTTGEMPILELTDEQTSKSKAIEISDIQNEEAVLVNIKDEPEIENSPSPTDIRETQNITNERTTENVKDHQKVSSDEDNNVDENESDSEYEQIDVEEFYDNGKEETGDSEEDENDFEDYCIVEDKELQNCIDQVQLELLNYGEQQQKISVSVDKEINSTTVQSTKPTIEEKKDTEKIQVDATTKATDSDSEYMTFDEESNDSDISTSSEEEISDEEQEESLFKISSARFENQRPDFKYRGNESDEWTTTDEDEEIVDDNEKSSQSSDEYDSLQAEDGDADDSDSSWESKSEYTGESSNEADSNKSSPIDEEKDAVEIEATRDISKKKETGKVSSNDGIKGNSSESRSSDDDDCSTEESELQFSSEEESEDESDEIEEQEVINKDVEMKESENIDDDVASDVCSECSWETVSSCSEESELDDELQQLPTIWVDYMIEFTKAFLTDPVDVSKLDDIDELNTNLENLESFKIIVEDLQKNDILPVLHVGWLAKRYFQYDIFYYRHFNE